MSSTQRLSALSLSPRLYLILGRSQKLRLLKYSFQKMAIFTHV